MYEGRMYKLKKQKYDQQNYHEHSQKKVVIEHKWKIWTLHNHGKKKWRKLLYLIIYNNRIKNVVNDIQPFSAHTLKRITPIILKGQESYYINEKIK